MTVRLVDSKQHMLSPNDIFIAAAHEDKVAQKTVAEAAKKAHVTPERMAYSVMLKEYSDPRLVRIRSGNSLFTIAAMKGRTGFCRVFNGDTPTNFVNNMTEFMESARKMGFDFLVSQTHSNDIVRLLKIAAKRTKTPGVKTFFDSRAGIFAVATGEKRGE